MTNAMLHSQEVQLGEQAVPASKKGTGSARRIYPITIAYLAIHIAAPGLYIIGCYLSAIIG